LKDKLAPFKGEADGSDWAVVTGASEGIGRSYALQLARCGYNVKLVARSVDKLESVANDARALNNAIRVEVVPLDVSRAAPSDFAALFNEKDRTSVVINNAGIMKNQRLLQTDPALLEQMIKTNVHPYVYMTKHAIQHFLLHEKAHNHLNALVYVSSSAAFADMQLFGPYAGTKTHNLVLGNMVRDACLKSIGDLVTVQTVHPLSVTTNLNGYIDETPDAVPPDACASGSLCDLASHQKTGGAVRHTFLLNMMMPLFRSLLAPLNLKAGLEHVEKDRRIIVEPYIDQRR